MSLYKFEDRLFRVLWSDAKQDLCYYIEIKNNGKDCTWPTRESFSKITTRFTLCEKDMFASILNESSLSPEQKAFRDVRFFTIKAIVSKIEDIFEKRKRNELIRRTMSNLKKIQKDWKKESKKLGYASEKRKIKKARSYIQYLVKQYLIGGCTKNALLSRYSHCGPRGERADSDVPTGRPQSYSHDGVIRPNFNMDSVQKQLLKNYWYNWADWNGSGLSTTFYDSFLATVHENAVMYPSYKQVRDWIHKMIPMEEILKQKHGSILYNNNHRTTPRMAREGSFGLGYVMLIDATPFDVSALNMSAESKLIGRPVLCIAVDLFSGMPLGFYLGPLFESFNSFTLVLLCCCEPKNDIAKKIGVNDKFESQWNACGIGDKIQIDRAPPHFHAHITETAKQLESTISLTNSYNALGKAAVEAAVHKLNKAICQQCHRKGHVSKAGTKIDGDTRKQARLTWQTLRKVVYLEILKFINKPIAKYPLSPEMLRDNVTPTPKGIFEWAERKGYSVLRTQFDSKELKRATYTEIRVRVDKYGFHYRDIIRFSPVTPEGSKFHAKLFNANQKRYVIRCNAYEISEAFVQENDQWHPVIIPQSGFETFETLEEVHSAITKIKSSSAEAKKRAIAQNRSATAEQLAVINREASRKKPDLKGIKDTRMKEKNRELKSELSINDFSPTKVKAPEIAEEEIYPTKEHLLKKVIQKQKEK